MGNCFKWMSSGNKNEAGDQGQEALLTDQKEEKRSKDKSDTEDDVTEKFDKKNSECIFVSNESALEKHQKKISIDSFTLKKVLGKGSFGKVMLVESKLNNKLYAMKILKKDAVAKRNQRVHTQGERKIMEAINCPFIVKLHYAFQTPSKLYFVMDFMQGGELFFHLRKSYKFNEMRAKLYAAEIIIALEHLHSLNIIYRDLKPENILLDVDGHIKIADFGLSKQGVEGAQKTYTFCGTPEYLAPEILLGKGHDKAVDWWSLGALLYEMISGAPPFYSRDRNQMFNNILTKPIEMKPHFSPEASSVLQGLLTLDAKKRLGASSSDASEIKQHAFFSEISWDHVYKKKIEPPFKPRVSGPYDLRHFDKMFTGEPVQDTPTQGMIGRNDMYPGFTYQNQFGQASPKEDGSATKMMEYDAIVDNPNFSLKI